MTSTSDESWNINRVIELIGPFIVVWSDGSFPDDCEELIEFLENMTKQELHRLNTTLKIPYKGLPQIIINTSLVEIPVDVYYEENHFDAYECEDTCTYILESVIHEVRDNIVYIPSYNDHKLVVKFTDLHISVNDEKHYDTRKFISLMKDFPQFIRK
jgi:hypothetical protein